MRATGAQLENLTHAEKILLLILGRAKEMGIDNLSKHQLHKISYLIEVEARRFAALSLFDPEVKFYRENRGPVSYEIYTLLGGLSEKGYVKSWTKRINPSTSRHCYQISETVDLNEIKLGGGEMAFLGSTLSELLQLTQPELTKKAYSTEPMIAIQKEEAVSIQKGYPLDLNKVLLDEEIVDLITDESA